MRSLKRALTAFIAVGMLLLGMIGLNPFLMGMMAFAVLALTVRGCEAHAVRDGPRHGKVLSYCSPISMQFLQSGFAMTPTSRSYGGMGRQRRSSMASAVRRVYQNITYRLVGLRAKIQTQSRPYNARDSDGYLGMMLGLHYRESPTAGYA